MLRNKATLFALTTLLLSSSAFAADVFSGDKSLKDDSNYAGASVVNWTGFYVGGSLGYGNANHNMGLQEYFKDYCTDDVQDETFDGFSNSDRRKTLANRKKAAAGDSNYGLNSLYDPLDDTVVADGTSGSNPGEDKQGQFIAEPLTPASWAKCEDVQRGLNSNRGAGDLGSATVLHGTPGYNAGDPGSNRGSASTGGGLSNVSGDSREVIGLDGINSSGLVGDARLGFDLARGRFLFGVFASYGFSDMSTSVRAATLDINAIEKGDEWSIGGRVGYIVAPRTLAYVLAAYTETDYSFSGIKMLDGKFTGGAKEVSFSGVTVGGGVEFAVTQNIFFGIEGTHTFYGKENIADGYNPVTNEGVRLTDEIGETKVMGTLKIKLNSGLGLGN
jgi:opacity protein-like surface antigen